ncbi:Hypothetical protein POVN_LOCUS257 [uncultured virus]|nr:Hypothetical protein POVN_LOCUS257 [uncultured virus]
MGNTCGSASQAPDAASIPPNENKGEFIEPEVKVVALWPNGTKIKVSPSTGMSNMDKYEARRKKALSGPGDRIAGGKIPGATYVPFRLSEDQAFLPTSVAVEEDDDYETVLTRIGNFLNVHHSAFQLGFDRGWFSDNRRRDWAGIRKTDNFLKVIATIEKGKNKALLTVDSELTGIKVVHCQAEPEPFCFWTFQTVGSMREDLKRRGHNFAYMYIETELLADDDELFFQAFAERFGLDMRTWPPLRLSDALIEPTGPPRERRRLPNVPPVKTIECTKSEVVASLKALTPLAEVVIELVSEYYSVYALATKKLLWALQTEGVDAKRVQQLLNDGANVNAADHAKYTPLYWAIGRYQSVDVIRLLINAGANTKLKNPEGETPLQFLAFKIGEVGERLGELRFVACSRPILLEPAGWDQLIADEARYKLCFKVRSFLQGLSLDKPTETKDDTKPALPAPVKETLPLPVEDELPTIHWEAASNVQSAPISESKRPTGLPVKDALPLLASLPLPTRAVLPASLLPPVEYEQPLFHWDGIPGTASDQEDE